jgi:proprotein convertase subtilisin/kexin type 2
MRATLISLRGLRPVAAAAFTLLLSACGGGGASDAAGTDVGEEVRGQAPLAAISAGSYVSERAPFRVDFDGSGSSDADGSITSYSWSFGDGATASGATASHEYQAAGTYSAVLTVTDDSGNTASHKAVVTVIAPGEDPLYPRQWHLANAAQSGGLPGEDVNALPVWRSCADASCRGEGVRIAVVDDGLEIAHEDLSANIVNGASYDYLSGGTDPTPKADQAKAGHGTAVAGIAAGRDQNSLGGRGVAPRAELVGYNMLQNATLSNQADAMARDRAANSVSTNSWGAPDGSGRLQASDLNWRSAIETGLREGRGGKGIVYTWAAGNGDRRVTTQDGRALPVDNSNYDGQANFYGVTAVAALDHFGRKASYSEPGANLWVSAPGGESCQSSDAIVTSDLTGARGLNSGDNQADLDDADYTACMNGTSAATPMVAGVAALVLQANPALSWRDVKLILAQSARKNDVADAGWTTNGAGIEINHKYGFGAVDAEAAVTLARGWAPVAPMRTFESQPRQPNLPIPDNDGTGVSDTLTISGSGISQIEFVEVYFTAADHPYAGDLEVTLTHLGTGTQSRLAETHVCDCSEGDSPNNWRFGSSRHLNEAADGQWRLTVKDQYGQDMGTFQNWRLVIRGR